MFWVVFESTVAEEATSVSGIYYEKLQKILQGYAGFISETPFTSINHPNSDVLIANFDDEAAAHRWRQDPTHLRIQKAAREKLFTKFRVRAGPSVSLEDLANEKTSSSINRLFMVINESRDNKKMTPPDFCAKMEALSAVSDVEAYEADDKLVYLISWTSNSAALDFVKSSSIPVSSITFLNVARDYGRTSREEAPTS